MGKIQTWLILASLLLLNACTTNSISSQNQNPPSTPIASSGDRQVKIGSFDFVTPTPLSPSPTPSPTPTPTPTPSVSPSPTLSPSPSHSPTPTPSRSPSPTPSSSPPLCQLDSLFRGNCVCNDALLCVYNGYTGRIPPIVNTGHEYCVPTAPYCEIGNPGVDPRFYWCVDGQQSCNDQYERGECQLYCWAKPVIYLYPKRAQLTSVFLDIPGFVTVSDPHYPSYGWQDVLALPNGTLVYQGRSYPYLYYESSVTTPKLPQTGVIIPTNTAPFTIALLTKQLGLNNQEQSDFLDYWLPRISQVKKPYLLIQVLDKETKALTDHVVITPEPDTKIELLFAFTALDKARAINPLVVPELAPKRAGFTMVEWGGSLVQ